MDNETPVFPSFCHGVWAILRDFGPEDLHFAQAIHLLSRRVRAKPRDVIGQKQEKIYLRRMVGDSTGGDWRMMCTNHQHILLLSPRAWTCFFQHQQTISVRLSAHNCQLYVALTRIITSNIINLNKAQRYTMLLSCFIAFQFIVWRWDPNTIAGREPQSWPVRRAHRKRPSNWVPGLTRMSRLNESWLIQHGSWIYSLVAMEDNDFKEAIHQYNAMEIQTSSIW